MVCKNPKKIKCKECSNIFEVYPYQKDKKYCTKNCYYKSLKGRDLYWIVKPWNKGLKGICTNTGRTHFKKGRRASIEIKNSDGYILVWKPNHPNARDNRVKRANLVMEKHLGRYLTKEEVIHHKNEIKDDDGIKNLGLFKNQSKHMEFHWSKRC